MIKAIFIVISWIFLGITIGFLSSPECKPTIKEKIIHWYHTDTLYMADGDSIITMYLRDRGFKMWTVMRFHDDSTQDQWLRNPEMWKKLIKKDE